MELLLRGIEKSWSGKMIDLLRNFGIKRYFSIMILLVLLTDLTIFLNIPLLRQVLAFLCFTIIPGLLILHILKLNKIEFLKKIVLSIGLSIAFLMFIGFFINQLYLIFGFSEPLSTFSLVISFTFILVILAFIAYKRNKNDFDLSEVFNIKLNFKKDLLISPLIFPLFFPFLAVFGTYLMNTEGNNIILMTMIFLIPIYVAFIVYLRNRIPKVTYPVAILAIGIAIILMHGLTSHYLIGRDVHYEYYAFRVVANHLYWSMSNYHSSLTACLSTSLLPAIYWSLMDIKKLYVYKLVYQIIWAFTPLVCYIMFKKYMGELYAFLASFFFIAQLSFFSIMSAMRTELAVFFFAFAMMVFFDDEMDKLSKRALFLIFMFAVIVSHYSTSYIFFIMIFVLWLVIVPMKNFFKSKYSISTTVIILFFGGIFLWYSQLTSTAFTGSVLFVEETFANLANMFIAESREMGLIQPLTGNVQNIPEGVSVVVQWIIFIFIFVGAFDLIKAYKNKNTSFEAEYILITFVSLCLLALMVILPFISIGYGADRTYQQSLVLLSPAFIIGGTAICKYIRRPQFILLLIMIVIIAQFFCATQVVYQAFGIPHSECLNREGDAYGELYIHDQEVIGAKWLCGHRVKKSRIYTDVDGGSRLMLNRGKLPINRGSFAQNETVKDGYLYLRHANVVEGKVYTTSYHKDIKNMTEYLHQFVGRNKIYNNGGSEVYR